MTSRLLRYGTGLLLALCLLLPLQATASERPSIAFYYGSTPPLDELSLFSRVVVEPEHMDRAGVRQLQAAGSQAIAYVSVGEARRERSWFGETKRAWELGENKAWASAVMDMASTGWQEFVLDRLIAPLAEAGYDGLFLDTLDSYQLVTSEPGPHRVQQEGLIGFIDRLHRRFPGMKILLNRGFEVVPRVHDRIDGVVAESLFRTWDPVKRTYGDVGQEQQQWLQTRLEEIHDVWRLPVYVIDYVHASQREKARETARSIEALGFIPWVSNPELNMLGVSTLEIVPRKILLLYDSQEAGLPYSEAHRYLAAPLEYMGYVVEYTDVRQALPERVLAGAYAGVISWIAADSGVAERNLTLWLSRQIDEGVPVAFLGSFGMNPSEEFLGRLGLVAVEGKIVRPLRIVSHDAMAQMEARPRPLSRGLFQVRAISPEIVVHESIADAGQKRMDVIMTAPWGGVALSPYVLEMGVDDQVRWRLDIFRFVRKALHLQPMPIFDTTTENGLRLLMSHIDGDGVASRAMMPGSPLAIRVIRDEILKRYPLPVTVSVIAGEFENSALYPERVKEMRKIARSIFSMENVEIASHTYSHPFSWTQAQSGSGYSLKLPGYVYSQQSEIERSVRYIDEHLAPKGKKTEVFLWSGDALPDEPALRQVASLGLRNLNGGSTTMTGDHPSITNVSSMARPVGDQLQVYAPVMNEGLYTNNWTSPRYGFQRVIETFELTGRPRRLKPIDIYYHFYSGSELASVRALKEVYDWSMKQQTMPVRISEFADKVNAYMHASVARSMDGSWVVSAPDAIRTLRIPEPLGWPDMGASSGVAGVLDLPQGRYLHLAPAGKRSGRHTLRFERQPPAQPFLVSANGRLMQWQPDGNKAGIRLAGHVPLRFVVSRPCSLQMGGQSVAAVKRALGFEISLPQKDTGDALLICR